MSNINDISNVNNVRTSFDGTEDPPDFFHESVDDLKRHEHEAKKRSVEGDDAETMLRRLKEQTQLVQELTCQINRMEREMEEQRDQLDRVNDIEMENETLGTKFKIQSETIKTQQVRVNDALREKELAQKQSIEDAEAIAALQKEVSELALELEETKVALKNKTRECDHAIESYETLDAHASQLRATNAALSERVQILEELVDKFENEDLGAFFTRRGMADNAAARDAFPSPNTGARKNTDEAVKREKREKNRKVLLSENDNTKRSTVDDESEDAGMLLGRGERHTSSFIAPAFETPKPVVTVPTPMYAIDGHGTPIIPKPIEGSAPSPSPSVAGSHVGIATAHFLGGGGVVGTGGTVRSSISGASYSASTVVLGSGLKGVSKQQLGNGSGNPYATSPIKGINSQRNGCSQQQQQSLSPRPAGAFAADTKSYIAASLASAARYGSAGTVERSERLGKSKSVPATRASEKEGCGGGGGIVISSSAPPSSMGMYTIAPPSSGVAFTTAKHKAMTANITAAVPRVSSDSISTSTREERLQRGGGGGGGGLCQSNTDPSSGGVCSVSTRSANVPDSSAGVGEWALDSRAALSPDKDPFSPLLEPAVVTATTVSYSLEKEKSTTGLPPTKKSQSGSCPTSSIEQINAGPGFVNSLPPTASSTPERAQYLRGATTSDEEEDEGRSGALGMALKGREGGANKMTQATPAGNPKGKDDRGASETEGAKGDGIYTDAVLEGRGVFQTLRAKRMEVQAEEAKLRDAVLAGMAAKTSDVPPTRPMASSRAAIASESTGEAAARTEQSDSNNTTAQAQKVPSTAPRLTATASVD